VGVALSPSALLDRLGMSLECRRALPGETGADGLEPVPLPLQPRA